jgi:hypothetical protein
MQIEVVEQNDIELVNKARATRVNELQGEIVRSAQNMVQYAIEIGNILVEVKKSLGHGEFLPWVANNCDFRIRMAQNYMRLSENAQRVAHLEGVTSLREVLKYLEEPKPEKNPVPTRQLANGYEEIEVLEGEYEEIERSNYETTLINRNPKKLDDEFETFTRSVSADGSEDSWQVSTNKESDTAKQLSEAFTVIETCFKYLTSIQNPENKNLARRKEAAYFINAISKGLNHLSSIVNNWIERNPRYMEGDYMIYSDKMDDPIQIEKERSKPKFETVM